MGTAKTAKKQPGLNKRGIRLLADDLVAHKKRYCQNIFGGPKPLLYDETEFCSTVACLAGFCYSAEIGTRQFNKMVKDNKTFDIEKGSRAAGKKQLGLRVRTLPKIFMSIDNWPDDLAEEYYANGPKGRVVVALKGLQRLRLNGTIDPDPKKVHTRLPQLKALLATAKKAKVG